MRITLNAPTHPVADLLSLDVSPGTTVSSLKDSIQTESQIPASFQHLYHNGQLLHDPSKTMEELRIADGDMLALHVRDMSRQPASNAAATQRPRQPALQPQRTGASYADAETIRLRMLGDPNFRRQAAAQYPDLIRTLQDPAAFAQAYHGMQDQERQHRQQVAEQIARLNADPFDLDAQRRIEEIIREERVQENLQNAIEHNPEVFGRVHMLYIDVEVNGHKVKAFVDSGAQATIMSPSCAEACGIMRLIDKRFAGIARGVGTANILGRVHSAQIKIDSLHLPCSFTVMEGKDVDLLLGLDMLKRHQACIDLAKDKLVIQGVEVPFLGEADIPKGMEEERAHEPQVAGPGGITIGGRSGVVNPPPTQAGHTAASTDPQSQVNPQSSAPSNNQTSPSASAQPEFPAEDINQLVSLGFSREEVIQALAACDGNVEYAGGLLLG